MADKEIGAKLKLDSDDAVEKVKSFKSQLREATQQLVSMTQKFGDTSKEAVVAAKRVAELRDRMQDAKNLADAFNPDAKFKAFSNTLSGVAGGFSAITGVMGLLGDKSEDTQKLLLKVQSALAFSQGVNSILELKDTFKQLGAFIQNTTIYQKANTLATKAAAAVQKLFGIEVEATSTSFKVLKGAIVATGIGALIVLIGEVVSALQEWSSAQEEVIAKQKELKEHAKELADIGLKGEQESIERQTKLDVAKAQARGASEEEITKIQVDAQALRVKSQIRHYNEIKGIDEVAAQESLKRIKDLNTDGEVLVLQGQKKLLDKQKEAAKKAAELAKQQAEKRKQLLKEQAAAEQAGEDELRKLRQDANQKTIDDERQLKRQEVIDEAANEKAKIDEMKITSELRLQLIIANRQKERSALDAVEKEFDDKQKEKDQERLSANLEAVTNNFQSVAKISEDQLKLKQELDDQEATSQQIKLEELDKWYKDRLEIANGNESLINELTASYEKQRTNIVREESMNRLNVVSNLLGKAADIFGKQTAAGKVLAIAEATINTFAGATLALREKSVLPQPFSTIQKIASVATIIAAGLKSVREIAKTQVPGGGGGGGSVPSPSQVEAPLQATPQVGTTALDQNSLNQLGNSTVRAFVVEHDVTDNQERITRLNRAARLGG